MQSQGPKAKEERTSITKREKSNTQTHSDSKTVLWGMEE